MRIERSISNAWATQLTKTVVKLAVAALKKMKDGQRLSGEDSGLKNVWDEICVQVQSEESVFWGAYLETAEGILLGLVEALNRAERLALWAETDEGWDYVYDHRDDEDGAEKAPVFNDEIVNKLRDELLSVAAGYSNKRIEKYLCREPD